MNHTTDQSGSNDCPQEDEAIANASLIAAAPELVKALDELVMAIELPGNHCEVEQALRHAKSALAKAVGRA